MKRNRLTTTSVIILIVVMLASFGVAGAQTYPQPGKSVTNIVVQNTSTTAGDTAAVIVQYYDPQGNLDYTNAGNVTIEPKAVKEIKTENEPLGDGWQGSAVMSSDKPLAAIVSIKNSNVPGAPDGFTQGAYNGSSEGATTLYFPSLFGFQFIVSRLTVQNTEGSPASVTVKFYDRNGNPKGTTTDSIPAYSQKTYFVPDETPADFVDGSAVVTSANKLAGAAVTTWGNRSAAYQALTDANKGTTLYAPSHYRFKVNASDPEYTLFSALNLQNTSATNSANITAKYYKRGQTNPSLTLTHQIPPFSAAGLNTKNGGDKSPSTFDPLGTDWDGSVTITSDRPLVGIGITNWGVAGNAGNYALVTPAEATDTIFVPAQFRLQWVAGQWAQWSAINLQNVGGSFIGRNNLSIEYIDTNGNTIETFTGSELPFGLAPGAAIGLNTRNGGDLNASQFNNFPTQSGMPRFIGGIYITAPAGSKLVGVANIIYNNRASVYNAFPGQ